MNEQWCRFYGITYRWLILTDCSQCVPSLVPPPSPVWSHLFSLSNWALWCLLNLHLSFKSWKIRDSGFPLKKNIHICLNNPHVARKARRYKYYASQPWPREVLWLSSGQTEARGDWQDTTDKRKVCLRLMKGCEGKTSNKCQNGCNQINKKAKQRKVQTN